MPPCPLRSARAIRIAGATVLASRISYAGELGWELTVDTAGGGPGLGRAPGRLGRGGCRPRTVRLSGARCPADREGLSLLRDRHDDAGHSVRGRPRARWSGSPRARSRDGRRSPRPETAAAAGQGRRLRTIRLADDGTYLPVYGGEAVRLAGDVVGRLRSVAYCADGRARRSATSTWIDRSSRARASRSTSSTGGSPRR